VESCTFILFALRVACDVVDLLSLETVKVNGEEEEDISVEKKL